MCIVDAFNRLCYVFPMRKTEQLERIVTALAGRIGIRSHADPARFSQAAEVITREFESLGYCSCKAGIRIPGNRVRECDR